MKITEEWLNHKRDILQKYVGYFRVCRSGYLEGYYGRGYMNYVKHEAVIDLLVATINHSKLYGGPLTLRRLYELVSYTLLVLQRQSYYMNYSMDRNTFLSSRNLMAIGWMAKLGRKLEEHLDVPFEYTVDTIMKNFQMPTNMV